MPNRILHESVCVSGSLAAVSPEAEVLFHRLTTKMDDFGRFDARPAVIRGALFALQLPYWTEKRITSALDELEHQNLIHRYTNEGRECLHAPTWFKYQRSRASVSKFPDPPESCCDADIRGQAHADDSDSPSSADIRGSRDVHVHVLGSEKKEVSTFAEFWTAYPRKVGKLDAERAWDTAIRRGADPAEIIAAAELYARAKSGEDPQYTKHPGPWLRAGRWMDEATVDDGLTQDDRVALRMLKEITT